MFDDFCGVRVVPIRKLFEKNTAGRRVGSGQCSTANVCYWVNSGRHLLNSSSSGFDPKMTCGDALLDHSRAPSLGLKMPGGPQSRFHASAAAIPSRQPIYCPRRCRRREADNPKISSFA